MNVNKKSSSCLQQFSWEEWDNQMIFVLYRSGQRYVVKRYIERVLANSSQWQKLAQSSFANLEPIPQAYTMTENEVKLIHHIFSWHLNGTLTFPIIGGLDQLLDWEDVLDFMKRAEDTSKNKTEKGAITLNSPSIVATIPVGISSLTMSAKKNVGEFKQIETTPIKIPRKVRQPPSSSSFNQWVQINNICVPYIIKSSESRLVPYQVLLDCDLLNEQEQSFLRHFTIKSSLNDIQTFERIISTSSSIDFKLDNDLLLIDLDHLIFGMSKIVYIKLLNNQKDVNKSYKRVLAQSGGIIRCHSHLIPFISLGKLDYILFDSLVTVLQPFPKTLNSLRRRAAPAQTHEIDYLRLVQFYQRKSHQDDSIVSNPQQQQLIISLDDIQKYVKENNFTIDLSLTQYQQSEYLKLRKQTETNENKPIRKPTKRKASTTMAELQNIQ